MTIIVTPTHCQIFFYSIYKVITKENGTLSMAVLLMTENGMNLYNLLSGIGELQS